MSRLKYILICIMYFLPAALCRKQSDTRKHCFIPYLLFLAALQAAFYWFGLLSSGKQIIKKRILKKHFLKICSYVLVTPEEYSIGFAVAPDAHFFIPILILAVSLFSPSSCTVSIWHNRGNLDQNPSYFAKPLIGSCSSPWGNFAPITKDSLSSPLHECQKPEGKIAGEALVESSYSVLTFDFHKTQGAVYFCRLTWLERFWCL